jgi:hypothetical protein
MSEYFDISQQIRSEIESNKGLTDKLNRHMSRVEFAEFIGEGTANAHYRMGRLESGLWLAARQRKCQYYLRASDTLLSIHESYAETAEEYWEEGKLVSKFCVAAFKENNAVLLVEDLTEGGKRKIYHNQDEQFGYYEGTEEVVWLDLESNFANYNEFKFMNRKYSINF